MQLRIEKLVPGGDGLGRMEDGRVIFIPGVLPGELIDYRITRERRDFCRGEATDILESSPARVEAPCPYVGRCGGCDFQHVNPDKQSEIKKALICESLERTGKIDTASCGITMHELSDRSFAYRTRARFHVDTKSGAAGFLSANSDTVVSIEHCMVLDPRLSRRYEAEHHEWGSPAFIADSGIGERRRGSVVTVPMTAGDDGAAILSEKTHLRLAPKLMDPKTFSLDAQVFFQSNQGMFEYLLDHLIAPLPGGGEVVDLFAGVGVFSAFIADRYEKVVAVERDRRCLTFAQEHLNTGRVSFFTESVERYQGSRQQDPPDLLIVDPPRTGLSRDVVGWLSSLKAQMIIYVSCNPVTLARDLSILTLQGPYELQRVDGYDFYPQTSHIEASAVLRLR
jgi:23S rRNA (uracil1939-C5)-methyltransferase